MTLGHGRLEIVRPASSRALAILPSPPSLPSPPLAPRIPPAERLFRTHAEFGDDNHHPRRLDVVQREEEVSAMKSQRRAAFEKVRDVGAQPCRSVVQLGLAR